MDCVLWASSDSDFESQRGSRPDRLFRGCQNNSAGSARGAWLLYSPIPPQSISASDSGTRSNPVSNCSTTKDQLRTGRQNSRTWCGNVSARVLWRPLGSDTEVADRSVYREIHALHPLVNRREDSPQQSVLGDQCGRVGGREGSPRAGLEVVGWYHSHPDHPATSEPVRSRACLAVVQLHHRRAVANKVPRRHDFLAAGR